MPASKKRDRGYAPIEQQEAPAPTVVVPETIGLPTQVGSVLTSGTGHRSMAFTWPAKSGRYVDLTIIRHGEDSAAGFLFDINDAKLLSSLLNKAIAAAERGV